MSSSNYRAVLVNVSPALLLSSSVSCYSLLLLLSAVFSLPLPPLSCSWIISLLFVSAVSFPPPWADDYSNKQHLSLQITAMIQTPLLLQLSVVVVYWAALLCLRCISPPHASPPSPLHFHACLWVTWWPHCDPQRCSHWWFNDLAGKAVAHYCSSLHSCA